MAAPILDAQRRLTLPHPFAPSPLLGELPVPAPLLTADARMTLAVLAAMGAGLSLFAGLALCDLFPFIGVMLRGF
ncbi:hypothetical protein FBZ89_13818 [Nitrospirillum amazonense]|uniref:Uncharacterized protein n=1 Tax=Nitrospirillum amazonense TaxID=28077 RepID=A0A560EK51_9PROT|nr:hypothetical protein [Nitrospirillum amazonense]TWB09717.1 hypothetical protein FBZ89_13818 [Nitrospirillum amazonense]